MAFLKNISSNKPDEELVAVYKGTRDPEVLGQLFERYIDLIYGVCLKYLKNPENAQDSTIALFEELGAKLLKHEVDHFKGWLYTLAKNHCLMRLRSEKKGQTVKFEQELVQSEEMPHLNGVMEKEADLQQLEYCLGQLGVDQRRAIELFYLQGKCYNEIADATGIEWNKIRSFIQNGRRNLKICMEAQKKKSFAN